MRRDFFGPDGDTTWNLERLRKATTHFTHHPLDIRDRAAMADLVRSVKPDLIIHSAAQPSHDLAKDRPFDDFDVNAVGTLNLLEAMRESRPESPFIFMSTNKVYGDAPNELPLNELATRWDYADAADWHGIAETCRIDATLHSLFGASKVAADVMVQEYGRYFGMPTVCFRGGCLTGPNHSGVELHGFLSYLARCVREGRAVPDVRLQGQAGARQHPRPRRVHRVPGVLREPARRRGLQPRRRPRQQRVGARSDRAARGAASGRSSTFEYVDQNRVGDHICYISDLRRLKADYPGWDLTRSLDDILRRAGGAAGVVTGGRAGSAETTT